MKARNLLKGAIYGCLVLFLVGISTVALADPDVLVAQGKEKLFHVDAEGNPDGDLIGANADFQAALGQDPTHPQANFWYGLTRVLVLIQSTDAVNLLNNFGFTKEDGITPLDQAALNPFNPDIKPPLNLPSNSPTFTAVQNFFKTTFLAKIDLALTQNFNPINENTFTDTVNFGDGPKELDGGEVLACRAMFNFFSAWLHSFCVYDFNNLDIDALIAKIDAGTFSINNDILILYPNLLKPIIAEAPAQLAAAKSALKAMLNSALATINFIKAETDGQSNDLITIDTSDPDIAEEIQMAQNLLNSFLASLNGPTPITIIGEEDEPFVIQTTLDLSKFFDGANPINLRSLLPTFTADNEVIRSSFPDPTMGGILPGTTQADLNHLCGIGPELLDVRVAWTAGEPSVELTWEQETDSDFSYYRIYRTTTPQNPGSWVQIGSDIINRAATTLTDNTVDESESRVYYYRLHTYYTPPGTDATYSDVEQAVLVVYVDVNSTSGEEDGSKENPFKDLGEAIGELRDSAAGAKICVAAGTYRESDRSLWFWRTDGIILEGGYKSTDWTRDIKNNETVIDGTDLAGNVIGIYNVSNVVVDGFTIKGAQYNGIQLNVSTGVTVRNCLITNNAHLGIGAWNSSSLTVEDCTITQNQQNGIHTSDNVSLIVDGCEIFGNQGNGISIQNVSPNKWYSVYGGNTYISGVDGYHPENHGYTFLGSDTTSRTYYGTYNYYIIVTNSGQPVMVDTVQGSDGIYYATYTTGNTQNWQNVGGTPDGAYATIGTGDTGGYILIDPAVGNTSLKVYIVDAPSTGAKVEIQDCTIKENQGSGIFLRNSYNNATIKNNLIVDNTGGSGILCSQSTNAFIENNTIVGNGGNGGIQCQNNSNPTIKNNIIVNNNLGPGHFGIYCDGTSNPVISYNDVFGNDGGNYYNCSAGLHDISLDPKFVDGPLGKYYLSQTASWQSEDSPCIDVGDPAENPFDDAYTTRTDGEADAGRVDMGYHYSAELNSLSAVVINEFLPDPVGSDNGNEWVELYNRSGETITIGGCWIDDITGGGGGPVKIPDGITIAPHSFWVIALSGTNGYLNNDSDTVNFLWPNGESVMDSYAYTSTAEGASYYRYPDGGNWATDRDSTPTRDAANDGNGFIPPADIIIDNTDPNFTCTSGWSPSTSSQDYGSNYLTTSAGTGSRIATWRPDIPVTANYEVFVWYVATSTRATNAPYTVTHMSGKTTVRVNQRINGGKWVSIGTYSFAQGTPGKVTLTNNADERVSADAVKFVYKNSYVDIVIDNADPAPKFVKTSSWTPSTSFQDYGPNYLTTSSGTGSRKAIWTPTIPVTSNYEVFVWYVATSTRASNAPYTVTHAAGTTTKTVNQRINGGKWVSIDTYNFVKGTSSKVTLTNNADGEKVCADAVKFADKNSSTVIIIDNTDSNFTEISHWSPSTSLQDYGKDYLTASAGTGSRKATWTPDISVTANYEVFVWYVATSTRATNAPYTVTHAAGTTTKTVNQRINGGKWVSIDTYNFVKGTSSKAVLTNNADGSVCADAVKFVYRGN